MKTKLPLILFLVVAVTAAGADDPRRQGTTRRTATNEAAKPAPATNTAGLIRQRAETYYRSQAISANGVQVMSISVTLREPETVQGWAGRLRTNGSVKLVTSYKGKQLQETRSFEAITEDGKIIDFTAK
jgi:uncharacterized lipoprotein